MDKYSILALSLSIFCIGLIGILFQKQLIKIFISIEIMFFAVIMNFCYFSANDPSNQGHIATFVILIFGGITLAIVLAMLFMRFFSNKNENILGE